MKKYNLLKAILIVFAVFMILSWIIPSGSFVNGIYINEGINPVGLFDIVLAPLQLFNSDISSTVMYTDASYGFVSYSSIIVSLIMIGALYGVLNKTIGYQSLISKLQNSFKGHSVRFLIISVLVNSIISSLTGLNILLFVLIPFFMTVILKLGYSKLVALISTVGAMLIGSIAPIYASNVNGIARILFSIDINDGIISRIILFILLVGALILFLINSNKTKEEIEIPLYVETKKKSDYKPIIIISSVFFFTLMFLMFNWYYTFNYSGITEAYKTLMDTNIFNYPILKNVFGIMEPFGYFTGFTMSGILFIMILVIKFIYSISLDDIIDGVKKGIKDIIVPVFYVILSMSLMVLVCKSGSTFITSIINFILEKFGDNVFVSVSLSTITSSAFMHDFFAVITQSYDVLKDTFTTNIYSTIILIMESIHGIICLVSPTSIFLVLGLSYLKVPYTDWLKYIWKLLVIIILITLIVVFITIEYA